MPLVVLPVVAVVAVAEYVVAAAAAVVGEEVSPAYTVCTNTNRFRRCGALAAEG